MRRSADTTTLRRAVFRLGLRRQLSIALIWCAVSEVVLPGSIPSPAIVFLIPALFAWSMRAYRIASGLMAIDLTVGAIALVAGSLDASAPEQALWVMLAVLEWTTLSPARFTRRNSLSDFWAYAGRLRPVKVTASTP